METYQYKCDSKGNNNNNSKFDKSEKANAKKYAK